MSEFPSITEQLDNYAASRGFQDLDMLVVAICFSALCWAAAVLVVVWVL